MTTIEWPHVGPTFLASFLASLVECVEALTVVLAVGSVRGWRGALSGSGAAFAVLFALIAVLGNTLTRIPLRSLQVLVGALLLLFGLRWLRKAILRSAGQIALHDEQAAYAKNTAVMQARGHARGWDRIAFAAAFQITMLEGTEVVFIVVAIGAGGAGLLLSASIGALAALFLVIGLGFALHRPLANVPENKLKFAVGVLLSGFGTFWVGEGIGLRWPGEDRSIAALVAGYLAVALAAVPLSRTGSGFARVKVASQGVSVNWVRTTLREILGLFVDDGSFALAILAWLGASWILARHLGPAMGWGGVILCCGLLLILTESVVRFARRSQEPL